MPVGNQAQQPQLDQQLTGLALQVRTVMQQIVSLNTSVNGQGAGLTYLQAAGFSSAPDAANPGGVSDAQYYLNMLAYLNTVAALYFGTATQAAEFDFHNELSQIWGSG